MELASLVDKILFIETASDWNGGTYFDCCHQRSLGRGVKPATTMSISTTNQPWNRPTVRPPALSISVSPVFLRLPASKPLINQPTAEVIATQGQKRNRISVSLGYGRLYATTPQNPGRKTMPQKNQPTRPPPNRLPG